MADELHCISCGREMFNLMEDRGHQPIGGLSFHTYGHYGSSFFDPMDGSAIQIAVCDKCLQSADGKGQVNYAAAENTERLTVSKFDLGQLRHLYAHLIRLNLNGYANGIVSPIIRTLEEQTSGDSDV